MESGAPEELDEEQGKSSQLRVVLVLNSCLVLRQLKEMDHGSVI